MEMEQVSEQDYKDWRAQVVTQALYRLLREWKESIKDQWARGNFEGDSIQETALMNVSARGSIDILQQLIDMDWEQFNEGMGRD